LDTLNPYQSLVSITESSPEDLVEAIRAIQQPIKIVSIVATGKRHTCYFLGPFNKVTRKKTRRKTNG
jgi:hypothetical protein